VIVDGTIEGPIKGGEVILKSRAHVIGDIHHQSLSIENGASFEGRSVQTGRSNATQPGDGTPQASPKKPGKKAGQNGDEETSAAGVGGGAGEGLK
jgi:cytoskeletal protein CcmA (bactofilin family)